MSDYSVTEKFLHWLALKSPTRNEIAFDLEKSLFLSSAPCPAKHKHVFVQGLARAGTTILMREIYNTGQFASLTYTDMPFVICCNTWAAVTRFSKREFSAKERAHGDGISVDMDSPEALDEVFWRIFAGKDYIKEDCLQTHTPEAGIMDQFVDYIRLILRRENKDRYLSKNNNNILRLPLLLQRFPDSVFLLPIRRPLQHAASLYNQHRRFSVSESYTQRYMIWLGHHEFGATHRPFHYPDEEILSDESPQSLHYWLIQWLNYYSYLNRILADNVKNAYFVPYEQLCGNTGIWEGIMNQIGLTKKITTTFKQRESKIDQAIDPDLRARTEALYKSITNKALDKLIQGRPHETEQ